jgi:phospholipase/carboxylesterase
MTSSHLQNIEAFIAPLLRTLEALTSVARHLHPIGYSHLLRDAGLSGDELRTALAMPPWPEPYSALRPVLDAGASYALAAVDGLIEAAGPPEDITQAWRALRYFPRALETLYPLAGILPQLNRYFLDASHRDDADLTRRLMKQPAQDDTGVICFGDGTARDAVWVYVPESYDAAAPHPVVFALHGGSGNGRAFLWSWVRAARTRGAIVVAPSSIGQTWAIQGRDPDSPRLAQILRFVQQRWTIDATRILLTGMSDGGTFTYTSGLATGAPFTHLAPVVAAFHPMLTAMVDSERIHGLPLHILHGDKDWMFPRQMAEDAAKHFTAAGANVTYCPVADLSHTYGADLSTKILDWLLA